MPEWTPVQAKMLQVLSDGKPHTKEELHACLHDDLGNMSNIRAHLTAINKQLRQSEQEIVCISIGSLAVRYRWVKLLVYSE